MARLWVTWEKQRRNLGLSAELGFQLYEIISNKKGLLRYLECISKTIILIIDTKPTHVVVQNPSIVLAFLATIIRKIFKFRLAVDAHNAGIFPVASQSYSLNYMAKFIQRNSDITIVTNDNIKKIVELNGGSAFILPDKIPVTADVTPIDDEKQFTVCFICTYSHDEPYYEVIKSAMLIPGEITIVITGNYVSKVDPASVPGNVKLLGFLPEEDYWTTLKNSNIIMDLTTLEDCLVCGAYEGVSLLKPLILSDTQAIRNYFYKGCVYVAPDAKSIATGIISALENRIALQNDVHHLKEELETRWKTYLSDIKEQLYI